MGVEYQHWLVVVDPAFRPGPDAPRRVHAVLDARGLAGPHVVLDIEAGGSRPLAGALPSSVVPANALVVYRETVESEAVDALVGAPLDGEHHYLQQRLVLAAQEQHVLEGGEEIVVDAEGAGLAPAGYRSGLWTSAWAPASASITTRLRTTLPLDPTFRGIVRAALVLDFGKSLPAFVLAEEERVLEDRHFVDEIEEALGGRVCELGFVY